jgi:hypothetical protein
MEEFSIIRNLSKIDAPQQLQQIPQEPKQFEDDQKPMKEPWRAPLIISKETIFVWAECSTIHGMYKLFFTKFIAIRLIWILVFFTSAGFCIYMLTRSLLEFLAFDVLTKVVLIEETSAVFPQITICNANLFATNASESKFYKTN